MNESTRSSPGDESGAALILALVFIIVTGVTVAALLSFGGTSLLNSSNYLALQSEVSAANAATNIALETVRYSDPTINGGYCPPFTASGIPLPDGPNNATFWVTCSPHPGGLTQNGPGTRTVDFSTCGTAASCTSAKAIVTATVEFIDGTTCSASALAACGQQQSILNWVNAST